MAKNELDFRNRLDDLFLVSAPAIPGKGEDSACTLASERAALVSVFDGCGGLGSRTLPKFGNHTAAYVAARTLSGAIHDWFVCHSGDSWKTGAEFVGQLRAYMMAGYEVVGPYAAGGLKMRGSMARELPATAAMGFLRDTANGPVLHVIWAGDSRVYVLDQNGLAQLTKDDVAGEDAMSNLSNDGALTNVVSADGNFTLHHWAMRLQGPAMVFACTDGCFGYLPSPMAFEYAILNALEQAADPTDFRQKLHKTFSEAAGDDLAFSFLSYGFGSFEQLKKAMDVRYVTLWQQYIGNEAVPPAVQWETYRQSYERFL